MRKVVDKIWELGNIKIVSVQKLGKLFLLFSDNAIFVYGDEYDVAKFRKKYDPNEDKAPAPSGVA